MSSLSVGVTARGVVSAVLCGLTVFSFVSGPAAAGSPDLQPLSAEPAEPLGRTLFQAKGCAGCHALAGVSSRTVGPDLTDLAERAGARRPGYSSEAYVRESIREPQAFKAPGYGSTEMPILPVMDQELETLVAFLLGRLSTDVVAR